MNKNRRHRWCAPCKFAAVCLGYPFVTHVEINRRYQLLYEAYHFAHDCNREYAKDYVQRHMRCLKH